MNRNERLDRKKGQRQLYESNRRRVIQSQEVCALCGMPVDKNLKYPHPLSATADHIIPVSLGGSNQLDNLQLAHFSCNREKSNRILVKATKEKEKKIEATNRNLPQYVDWFLYSAN